MPDMEGLYKGTGISQGLDRGLLVYDDEVLLVEEGMGIGACALQANGFTYFTTVRSVKREGSFVEVESLIDRRLEFSVFGIRSKLITYFQELLATYFYMKQEKRQEQLLMWGHRFMQVFNVKLCFVKTPPLGLVKTRYEIGDDFVTADVSCYTERASGKLFIMNEAGGSKFDRAIVNGEYSNAPSGWQKMESMCELFSDSHSLAFSMDESRVPENVSSSLYWGREHIEGTCSWAGFENEILFTTGNFENYRYSIKFRGVTL